MSFQMIQHKNSEPEMEVDSADRISGLPDFVIHSVLSLLGRKDAVRTSVLSKRWNRIWETFPDLIFDQYMYTKLPDDASELSPEWIQKVGGFLDTVKRSLLRSTRCGVSGIKFILNAVFVDSRMSSELNECFDLALRSSATKIVIFHVGHTVLPETVFVPNPFQYRSLRELALSGIRLSEKSMNDIFLSCPNIGSLSLLHITGVRKLDICKLDRLEWVSVICVEDLRVCIVDAPKLRGFCFDDFHPSVTCKLDLTCRCLRELKVENVSITDEWLHSLITLCPLLEDLEIAFCKMLRKVKISAMHLTRLVFYGCDKITRLEIDAPALLLFKHQSQEFPRIFFKKTPSQMKIGHTLSSPSPTNTSRFVDLRNFLTISAPTDCLTVKVLPLEVTFDHEELRHVVVPPAFQLRHLQLELQYGQLPFDEQALVDGLLWSCHPKTISVFLIDMHSCVKILSKSLLEMEESPSCCGSAQVKCWRHDLKSATAQSFDGRHIRFELEWDDDSIW